MHIERKLAAFQAYNFNFVVKIQIKKKCDAIEMITCAQFASMKKCCTLRALC